MRLGCKRCILIYLGAILLMSHIISNNVHAEVTYNQNLTFIKRLVGDTLYYGDDKANYTWKRGTQVFSAGLGTTYFRFGNAANNFPVYNHQLIVLTGSFYATSAYATTFNTSGLLYVSEYYLNCPVVDISFDTSYMQNETGSSQITYRQPFTVVCEMTADATRVAMNIAVKNDSPSASNIGIYFSSLTVFEKDTTLKELYDWLRNHSSSDSAADVLEQEKQDVQDAADNSETAANNNSENAATTNLIGALSSLLSSLTSLNATNCNVILPFPSALGGNMTVNICQNKDYAGNIISIFGSLTLCVFYVPLALKLLSMIYNEIRSFTNG